MKTALESAKPAQSHPIHDVIIAGAGPVGLFLACELALANCSVLLLEKAENPHSPLKQLPFGLRGLNSLSVEALYRRGLLQELEVPKRFKTPHFTSTAGQEAKPQGAGHFARIPFSDDTIDPSQWKYRLPSSTAAQLFSELQRFSGQCTGLLGWAQPVPPSCAWSRVGCPGGPRARPSTAWWYRYRLRQHVHGPENRSRRA